MRKLIALIGIFLFSIGCGDKRPADVLPEDKFREIMWDMLRTSEFLDGYVLFRDSTLDKAATITAWYNKVYQVHNTTKAQFEKSYAYYQARPAVMKVMLDTLSKRQLAANDIPKDSATIKVPIDSAPGTIPSVPPAQQTIPVPSTTPIPSTTNPKKFPEIRGGKRNLLDSIRRMRQLQRKEQLN